MDTQRLKLASEMLRMFAEDRGNHGCNDWEWPSDWPVDARVRFLRDMHAWNTRNGADKAAEEELQNDIRRAGEMDIFGNPRNAYGPPDFAVIAFLAYQLGQEAANG